MHLKDFYPDRLTVCCFRTLTLLSVFICIVKIICLFFQFCRIIFLGFGSFFVYLEHRVRIWSVLSGLFFFFSVGIVESVLSFSMCFG